MLFLSASKHFSRSWLAAAACASIMAGMAQAQEPPKCAQAEISPDVIKACDALIADPIQAQDRLYFMAFRGHAAMVLGQTDAALADFATALKEGPTEWRFSNGEAPNPGYWAAMIEIGRGKPREAIAYLDTVLQRRPDDPRALAARAEALANLGNPDWAEAAMRAAIDSASANAYPQTEDPWNKGPTIETMNAELARYAAEAETLVNKTRSDMSPANLLLLTAFANAQSAEAAKELEAVVARDPGNEQAQFALGTVRFVLAVEHLGQALYRHGLTKTSMPLLDSMFILRMPVPDNPKPEPLTYDAARAVLDRFAADLALSGEALARVKDPAVRLDLDLKAISLDLDGNGRADQGEELVALYEVVSSARFDTSTKTGFRLRLDAADATWLEGYGHLLSGMTKFVNGYDWSSTFDTIFFRFFPGASVPNSELAGLSGPGSTGFDEAEIVDLIAFIHTLNWPVADPQKLAEARNEFLTTVRLSRENWARIKAETDNDHEWVPGPTQTGALAGMAVTDQVVNGWFGFLDTFEAILEGRILVPHWRYEDGINLKRLMEKPTRLDVVMWIQGPALKSYLDKGSVASGNDFNTMMTMLNGDIFRYAVWFN